MSIFEFLKDNPLVWILILISIAAGVILLFTKYLIIDNWDKIFKKKTNKDANDKDLEKDENNKNDN